MSPEQVIEDAMAKGPEGGPMMVSPAEILSALSEAGWRVVKLGADWNRSTYPGGDMETVAVIEDEWEPA